MKKINHKKADESTIVTVGANDVDDRLLALRDSLLPSLWAQEEKARFDRDQRIAGGVR